ncbi:amidohydrolase [Xylariomycetidae sp. FL0641]|nr:amidohydrolase [Xylariomycetidae sp. FL0641]
MTILRASTPGQADSASDERWTAGVAIGGIPEKVVKPWKLPPQQKYILRNANIVDPVDGAVHEGMTVTLEGGIIRSVSCRESESDADAHDDGHDAVEVDVADKYLCPGLIDCHVHLSAVPGSPDLDGVFGGQTASHLRQPFVCSQTLNRGFTTVRDCGGATLALREAIDDDVFPGPRLFLANRALSQTGGHGDRRGRHNRHEPLCCGEITGPGVVCDGVPDCTRAAREQLRTGADFVKIMVGGGVASPTDKLGNTQFTAEEVRAICEVARSYGTWVTAHAYTPQAIRHAVENGVMGIEHGNLMDEATARFMAERKVWLTPTLVTYDALGSDKYRGFLPEENARKNQRAYSLSTSLLNPASTLLRWLIRLPLKVLDKGLESLKIALDAGITMCYGSDLLGPLTAEQSREFGIRAQVMTSKQVLQCATVNGARMLRQENFLGQIKQGYAADLLVMNGNPLDDVSLLDRPDVNVLAVVKNGRVYSSRWSNLPEDVVISKGYLE